MNKNFTKLLFLLLFCLMEPHVINAQVANDNVFWGIFDSDIENQNLSTVSNYTTQLGKSPSIVMWYNAWNATGSRSFPMAMCQNVSNAGYMPHIVWEPWLGLDAILSGAYDADLLKFGQDIKTFAKPVMLRFAHEFNGDWYPWSYTNNAAVPASKWITAFKYVHDKIVAAGGTNALWLWSPNNGNGGNNPQDVLSYYPGDNYVDWIAIDGYNFGNSQSWSSWSSFSNVFGSIYQKMVSNFPSKPIMLGETACSSSGGDQAAWISDMFSMIKNNYTNIKAFVWFNVNKETDWRFNIAPASTAAFKTGVSDPMVKTDVNLLANLARPAVTSVSISQPTATIAINGTTQLSATISPANATNKNVSWTSSNNAIATVNSTGLVTGVALGTATVTVITADGAKTATSVITVSNVWSTKIEAETYSYKTASPKAETCTDAGGGQNMGYINTGDYMNYNVNVPAAGSYTISYRVASVNSTGQIVIGVNGTDLTAPLSVPNTGGWQNWTTITVTANLPAGNSPVTIFAKTGGFNLNWWSITGNTVISVIGVTVAPASLALAAGSSSKLIATVFPSNATNTAVTWSSSNTGVATVDASGFVTAIAPGTANVTATMVDGAFTSTSLITVANVPCSGVSLSPTTISFAKGATTQLTATISPSNASNKNVSYSTSNTAIATVNATGLVTCINVGTATITVTTVDGSFTASSVITVANPTTFDLKIEAESFNNKSTAPKSETCSEGGLDMGYIATNDWMTWPVTIPTTGTYTISFRVASPNSNAQLRLDANSGTTVFGTANIPNTGGWQNWQTVTTTMTLNGGSYNIGMNALTGGFNINWLEIVGSGNGTTVNVTGISVSPSASLAVGTTNQLSAIIAPSNATNQSVTWTSSNAAVATVSSTGLLTGIGAGTANVTATSVDCGFIGVCTVTVTPSNTTCPNWQANTNYASGTVVVYNGQNYTSNNSWNGTAGDPYTATHSGSGWGWLVGGSCTKSAEVENIEPIEQIASLGIFPNPISDGKVNIAVSGFESEEIISLNILNISGKLLYNKHFAVEADGSQIMQINLGDQLSSGTYIVKIQGKKNIKRAYFIVN